MAKPGRLTPAAKTYVVWVQQEGSQAKSQGELKVGNNHKGDLKTATTLHTFNVFVTAETDAQRNFPQNKWFCERQCRSRKGQALAASAIRGGGRA